MSQAGHAKKVIWGLAAAAVVVLGVWLVKGTPDIGGPAAGTVGVAKRYAAPQIADEDVKLERPPQTIQAFLDSEAFGRVMADPRGDGAAGRPGRPSRHRRARRSTSDAQPGRQRGHRRGHRRPVVRRARHQPGVRDELDGRGAKAARDEQRRGQSQLGQNAAGLNSGLNQKAARREQRAQS